MKRILLSIFLSACITPALFADTYPKDPRIDILHYQYKIRLSDSTDRIAGEATIDARFLADGVTALRLDLANTDASGKGMTVAQVMANGKALSYTHQQNVLLVTLPAASRKHTQQRITVIYSGIPITGLKIGKNKYGDRTFFSDNWPDKGRHWLPMLDHPYDKATCAFIVTAPSHYQVVSNGLKKEETDLADGNRITHWKQSVPIAPWLYVLGVARFAVQELDAFEGKRIQTWVYHQDRDKGFYDFAEPTKKVLEYYSDRIGPFAYEKLANIQSNSVSGGMEAASAILYSEGSVVGDRNERWRNVVIHEIAHQWFGNAVTEYDWDDVWLSEGFATYFTLLFIEHQYGRDEFLKGLAKSKQSVDNFYAKDPSYRIIHDNLSDMNKVTSSQTYQKGSWTLHMLRGILGDEVFWKGIRSYYATYMNGNATTADFIRTMEEASGQDLKTFFDQWLYKPGALRVKGSWTYLAARKELVLQLNQVQADGSVFTMPLQLDIRQTGKVTRKTVVLSGKTQTITIPLETSPADIVLDPDHWILMDAELTEKK